MRMCSVLQSIRCCSPQVPVTSDGREEFGPPTGLKVRHIADSYNKRASRTRARPAQGYGHQRSQLRKGSDSGFRSFARVRVQIQIAVMAGVAGKPALTLAPSVG